MREKLNSLAPFAFKELTSPRVHPKSKVQSLFLLRLLVLRYPREKIDLCLVPNPWYKNYSEYSGPEIKVCRLHHFTVPEIEPVPECNTDIKEPLTKYRHFLLSF